MEGISTKSICLLDVRFLEAPFTDDEIKVAVWGCDGSKSTRSDGFKFVFTKNCWEILKEDIFSFVKGFHNKTILSKAITTSFITLIPNISHPINLEDSRPICLVGSLYKIVAKLLEIKAKVCP